MTDHHDPLAEHYQQHKRNHPAPDKLRRYVLQKNHQIGRKASPSSGFRQWQLGAAAVVAIFALVSIWGTSKTLTRQLDPAIEVAMVQYHGFDTSNAEKPDYQARKIRQFTAYQQRRLMVMSRYEQPATVVATGNSLVLSGCNEDIIALSDSLVATLLQKNSIPDDLVPGDTVDIAFNQDGYIIALTKPLPGITERSAPMCAES